MPRSIKRAVSLAAALVSLVQLGACEAFGRFGFLQSMELSGLRVDREGVIARTPHAELIAFAKPSRQWKATITSDIGQTVALDVAPNTPRKVAANLFAPGTSLYFDGTVEFHLKTTKAPFLTWKEGSVATGVPTPKLPWILVSFDGDSAPFLINLPSGCSGAFKLGGKPGDWSLTMDGPFAGWVRLEFPFGNHETSTATAGELGQLADKFQRVADLYLAPVPSLDSLDIASDEDGVTAAWTFSSQAVVPPALLLAPLGGYGVKMRTAAVHSGYASEDGPIAFTEGKVLRVRFPCKHIGPGRAVTLEGPLRTMPGSVAAIDIPSIVDLAVEAMRADHDPGCQAMADEATQTYLAGADFAMELWTRETVPYNASNHGLDLSAAYGLLTQAMQLSEERSPENAFLTSVIWRTDWLTCLPFTESGANHDVERRAAALSVVASAMSSVPAVRLSGALLEAGLAAERGLYIQRRRSGDKVGDEKFLEALYSVRHKLCGTLVPGTVEPRVGDMLLSSVRVLSPVSVIAKIDANGLALNFTAPDAKAMRLSLTLPPDTDVSADRNVEAVVAHPGAVNTVTLIVTPKAAGPCSLRLTPLPVRGPRVADLPPYAEARM